MKRDQHAWAAIAAATVMNLPLGSIYAFSVFLKPIEAELGLTRSALSPVQTLTHLLKLALGETAPLGPASAKAKEAALKLGKSPDIRADLAKAPELVERLRPLMMAS